MKFRIVIGIVQLFIVCNDPWLFVAASTSQYDGNKQVGSPWERAVAATACKELEKFSDIPTEENVQQALRKAERDTPYFYE